MKGYLRIQKWVSCDKVKKGIKGNKRLWVYMREDEILKSMMRWDEMKVKWEMIKGNEKWWQGGDE